MFWSLLRQVDNGSKPQDLERGFLTCSANAHVTIWFILSQFLRFVSLAHILSMGEPLIKVK